VGSPLFGTIQVARGFAAPCMPFLVHRVPSASVRWPSMGDFLPWRERVRRRLRGVRVRRAVPRVREPVGGFTAAIAQGQPAPHPRF